jgi:prepilin-type processing-associated H-X9-DG protein
MTVAGNSITLDARQPAFTAMAADLKPALERAQVAALRVKSMSNMRQLMMACVMYANDNKGEVPPAITDLGKYTGNRNGQTPVALLMNPQKPDQNTAGYLYVPAPEGKVQKIRNAAERLAIYESGDFGEGLNVAFWDGHVEFVNDKAKFDALLATAQAPAK